MPQIGDTAEATGRTLEEAKRLAAQALGASPEDCEYEVIEQASRGLFAKSNYRVRATLTRLPMGEPLTPQRTEGEEELTEHDEETETGETIVATQEEAQTVLKLVQGIFEAARADIRAEIKGITGRYVDINLKGKDTDLLLSAKEPAIDSLQFLVNAMLQRSMPRNIRATLDAKEHRAQRAATLERLAREIAEEVLKRKSEAVLDPLPAHERRIIHRALMGYPGLTTYSEGEEPNRRVVISPLDEGETAPTAPPEENHPSESTD
jgi:spoIIIJ-associated protein